MSAIPNSTPHHLVDYLIFLGGFEEKYKVRPEFPEGQGGEGRSNQKFIFGDMYIFWKNTLCSTIYQGELFLKM